MRVPLVTAHFTCTPTRASLPAAWEGLWFLKTPCHCAGLCVMPCTSLLARICLLSGSSSMILPVVLLPQLASGILVQRQSPQSWDLLCAHSHSLLGLEILGGACPLVLPSTTAVESSRIWAQISCNLDRRSRSFLVMVSPTTACTKCSWHVQLTHVCCVSL